jgi:hypothetical protein
MGSLKDGRFDLRPFRLIREVEQRGVASEFRLLALGANGQPNLLGVPGVVKSFSRGEDAVLD